MSSRGSLAFRSVLAVFFPVTLRPFAIAAAAPGEPIASRRTRRREEDA